MNTLILIDGNAIMHRAYHALPPLHREGIAVNAVYGFFAMFLKILQEQKPTYMIVCFDRAAPTFRQQLYAGYHENRPSLADDFAPQFAIVEDVLAQTKVPVFGVEGYEADDLIGTLAHQSTTDYGLQSTGKKAKQDALGSSQWSVDETIILTGDRDMLQLVNSRVKVLMPVVGITKMNLMGEKEVKEKYGVMPADFVDYKALIGDASDNYPGVSGIGPKTAVWLVQKFHSIENMYTHIHEIPEKIAIKLATDVEQAALAKKLATIMTDVPITIDIKAGFVASFDFAAMQEAFEKIGIKSLQQRIPRKGEKESLTLSKKKKAEEKSQLELL